MHQGNLFEEPSPPIFPSRRGETAAGFVPLTEIMPAPSAPRRVGIARLAAQAPEIDARNGVEYHELPCRTLLSRCDSRRVPFDFTINPYRGCEYGCHYCLGPETLVLYADMAWRPLGEVKPGDVLAGFDEYPPPGEHRRFRSSVVQAVWWSRRPTQRLITVHADVTTTAEHRWLQWRNFRWSKTQQLSPGRHLRYLPVTSYEELDVDYRTGYLAGISLGDATFRYEPGWRSDKLGFPLSYWRVALIDEEPLERIVAYLASFGIEAYIRPFSVATATRKALRKVEVRSLSRLALIYKLVNSEIDSRSYYRGFLAGFFDAEGHNGTAFRIAQKDVSVLRRVLEYGRYFGFELQLESWAGRTSTLRLVGDFYERVRFFSLCQPAIRRKRDALFNHEVTLKAEPVLAVEPGPIADVVDIQTSTGTFYAAGLPTHNCYAPYTHEFMELEQPQDFERKVFVKAGAREALIRDLRRLDLRGRSIAIGTATDPYQPAERRYRLTRALLEVLAGRRDLQLSVTTKSDLVARDVDLLARVSERNELHVNLTITTPHYALARQIEPRAPRPDKRLAAVRRLADAGVKVGVFLMPVMPHVNDAPGDLELLIRLAKEAGAHYLVSQVLFLRDCSRKRFFPFLEERFPELLPDYRRLFGAGGKGALSEYTRRKLEEIWRLKETYGLAGWSGSSPGPSHGPDQLALTW
jgi:DNA repair photolyase